MSRLVAVALAATLAAPAARSLSWSTAVQPKKGARSNGPVQIASLGNQPNLAVAFGGYAAPAAFVRRWAESLTTSSPSLAAFSVGAIYSVPGPFDAAFRAREIQTDALAAALAAEAGRRGARLILVAAHSSGSFVADATVAALAKKAPALLPRVAYFKLDGGWARALDGPPARSSAPSIA